MIRWTRAVLLCTLSLLLVSCGTSRPTSEPADTPSETPEQVIRSYFSAWEARDEQRMDALVTQHYRQELAASDYQSIDRISAAGIAVGEMRTITADSTRPEYMASYSEMVETTVEYELLENTPFEDAGQTMRFVIVVRETPSSPWRIDGLGTGP